MRNLKLLIEYDGTDFYGWQSQPDKRTVQAEIESALRRITNEEVSLIGASRTDQGVHAVGQVANFQTRSQLKLWQIKEGTNSLLSEDVYIKDIEEVDSQFHARFSAKSKVYNYYIIVRPSPLRQRCSWFVPYRLANDAMHTAASYLLGEHDFKNFSVADTTCKNTEISSQNEQENSRCTIYNLSLSLKDFEMIITIEANRFLRKMVRGIVGFIVDVGRRRFLPEDTKAVFNGAIKGLYFAPARGLCLMEVKY